MPITAIGVLNSPAGIRIREPAPILDALQRSAKRRKLRNP
jgi:hypothetical protein